MCTKRIYDEACMDNVLLFFHGYRVKRLQSQMDLPGRTKELSFFEKIIKWITGFFNKTNND